MIGCTSIFNRVSSHFASMCDAIVNRVTSTFAVGADKLGCGRMTLGGESGLRRERNTGRRIGNSQFLAVAVTTGSGHARHRVEWRAKGE